MSASGTDQLIEAAERADADALNALGMAAGDRGELDAAVALFRAAVAAGAGWAAMNLGGVLRRLGRYGAAAEAYACAAEAGVVEAHLALGNVLSEDLDQPDDARQAYSHGAQAGDLDALFNLALQDLEMGMTDEAIRELSEASNQGHADASERLAECVAQRDVKRAEQLYELAIAQGDGGALIGLAFHHDKYGDRPSARAAFQRAVSRGVVEAANSFGYWLVEQGCVAEAESIFRDALDRGDASVLRNLANLLADDATRSEEAWPLYIAAIATGDTGAVAASGIYLAEHGREHEARPILAQAAADGDDLAQATLVGLHRRTEDDSGVDAQDSQRPET